MKNLKTVSHPYFNSEEHFINYCIHVCRKMGIDDDRLRPKYLSYFSWTLAHESIFKHSNIKPPYAILLSAIKSDNPKENILQVLVNILPEIENLKNGTINIDDCKFLLKHEMPPNIHYSVQFNPELFTDKMINLIELYENNFGVYRLYNKEKEIIYIGKSAHIGQRIVTSTRERRASYVSLMLTKTLSDANLLEIYYIATLRPSLNGSDFTLDELTIPVKHNYKWGKIIRIYKTIY